MIAVEPLDEMREVLRRGAPGAEALPGTAEAIPLDDESLDVVTVAQAFHWFDPEPARAEIARVLRADGSLALDPERRRALRDRILGLAADRSEPIALPYETQIFLTTRFDILGSR